ncbi:hypothetical protein EMIHUDRAFT_237857 [Emiliania huxleyi CCMP1516]|uniref:GRAM domain-containing protein n=2 Tax=Emiliania huxleyi TaxID=2903 RepID=A0A0D3JP89_EMIH1|nr:hypothetical protein EMIHUDRAFT_237857 [Emiliania huxleyi CCMP1516]EOD25324.1 hypothetical protein EMIHUDRAFT_237857 [Emiliania huxleyi CCMP1516]|eukprot:XP_005777753.1 hypothetical protein EMIHUDRAFT_237857 [Emiliania huxleyi CCMP1516]
MLSALERLIIWLLRPILRRLLGRKASSVDMELQSGVLRLSDVELSRKTLAGLSLPLTISSATVRKLEVLLPWRKGVQLSTPFVVRIDGVSAVLCARMEAADEAVGEGRKQQHESQPQPRAEQRESSRAWLARRKAARLGATATASKEPAAAEEEAPPRLDAAQQRALLDMVLRSLTVTITNVSLRLEEGSGSVAESGAPARSGARLSWLEARLEAASLRCRRDARLPGLLAVIPLPAWLPWLSRRKAAGSREQEAAIELEATVSARWRDGEGEAGGAAPEAESAASEASVLLPAAALEFGVRLARRAAHAESLERHRHLRPPVRVSHPRGVAAEWWRYAGTAVLLDLGEGRRAASAAEVRRRAGALSQYEAELLRLGWGAGGELPTPSAAQLALEEQLDERLLLRARERAAEKRAAERAAGQRARREGEAPPTSPDRGGGSGSGGGTSTDGEAGLERLQLSASLKLTARGVCVWLPLAAPGERFAAGEVSLKPRRGSPSACAASLGLSVGRVSADVDHCLTRGDAGSSSSSGGGEVGTSSRVSAGIEAVSVFYTGLSTGLSARSGPGEGDGAGYLLRVLSGAAPSAPPPRRRKSTDLTTPPRDFEAGGGRSHAPGGAETAPALQLTASLETSGGATTHATVGLCVAHPTTLSLELGLLPLLASTAAALRPPPAPAPFRLHPREEEEHLAAAVERLARRDLDLARVPDADKGLTTPPASPPAAARMIGVQLDVVSPALELGTHLASLAAPLAPSHAGDRHPGETAAAATVAKAPTAEGSGGLGGLLERASVRLQLREIEVSLALADTLADREDDIDAGGGGERRRAAEHSATGPEEGEAATASLVVRVAPLDVDLAADASGVELKVAVGRLLVLDRRRGVPAAASAALDVEAAAAAEMPLGVRVAVEGGRCVSDEARSDAACMPTSPLLCLRKRREEAEGGGSTSLVVLADASSVQLGWSPGLVAVCYRTLGEAKQAIAEAEADASSGARSVEVDARVGVLSLALRAEPLPGPWPGADWDVAAGETFEVVLPFEGRPAPPIVLILADALRLELRRAVPAGGGRTDLSLAIATSVRELSVPEDQGSRAASFSMGSATAGVLDVTVDVSPVCFDMRIAPMLRGIEYIERGIRKPLALLIMPTVSDGALEFRAVDVSVASTSVSESTLLDLITELPELSLTLRKPLSNLAASKANVPLQQLDINLPDATAHLGLCPADVALLLGVWLDNLNVFPLLPKGKVEFDRRKTVMMRICVRLTQAALWLHDVEGHRALLRLRLDDVRVTVSKALDTKTQISVTLGSLSAHVNAVTADGDAAWLPMLAPPLDGPAAAAEASAAVGAAAEATAGAATPKDADGARPADTGVAIAVATKGEEPDEVDISLGRLCVSLHAEPLMRLTEFGAFAGSCCSAGASSVGSSAVVESTVGSTLRLAVPMIQLVVSEPSPAAVRDADGTCDDGGGAGPLPMSLHCARDVLPRIIALHFGLTLELSKAAANYDEAAAQSKTEQMTLVLRHHHACAPLGYHELPAPDATLLSPAAHEARAPGGLCTLRALPSAADSTAALLEPFKLHASQSQRLSRRHASLMLEQPIRLSLSRETLPCVPTPLTPTKPAALGTGSSSASLGVAPDEQLSAIGSIPGVEVTLLSADRLPLPLVQLALGGEGQPITVAVEQASSALPLLAEACVPLSARWHNAGLLCWEPLIEPADIQLKAQQSSAGSALTTINVGLSSPLELNLSDSMLRDAQVNLRAGLAARAVRLAHNETGESLDYWATEGETGSGPERDGQQGFGGGGGRWGGDKSGGREVRAPPDAPCRLAAGGTARLDLWDRAAAARMAVGGWCEDLPRRLTVQIEGAAPFAGLVVNQPGTSVIPVTVADEGAAPAPLARALVCEVEDRDGGTWLVIRSMMSLVNCTQRTLAVDMDLPGEPLQHAGLLRPGGGTLPAEEEAAWRSLSGAPESEHLVKLVTCTLSASEASVLSKATATAHAGDLYLGSAALYFLGSRTAFVKERRELSLPYSSIADRLTENVALRSKFGLEHDPSLFVLAEFGCALVHAEGSSKGKLYVTQRYLCFKGSLFGRETRAVYAFDEVLSVEPCESPAPNSISLACTTSEERFTFFGARAPVLAILSQMLAVSRGDHLLPTEMGAAPSAPPELTPSPFLERPRVPLQPFVVRPLPLGERCHLLATCWRFPVKATSVTGCPATVLLQAPAAVQNLLPEPLEWRITSGRGEPPVARDELPPHGELHEICCMVAGGRYALQLRLPGYDWSSPIDLDSRGRLAAADRLEMVRLRPRQHVRQEFAENGRRRDKNSVLRLLVQLRSGCRCARQLLQEEESRLNDNQTLLQSVGPGARHAIAVRVAPDALELGASAARSLRAGRYDLALHLAPLQGADHGRIKVVTFVQRFWLSNRVGLALECEQHDPKSGGLGSTAKAAAAAQEPSDADAAARAKASGRERSTSRIIRRTREVVPRDRTAAPLAAGERAPWHWPSTKEESLLRVRPAPGQGERGFVPGPDEGWSSAFPIDAPGSFLVFCWQGVPPEEEGWWPSLLRLLVSVELVDARIEVTFELAPPSVPSPIRVDNQTSFVATFWQRGVERAAASPHRVAASRAAPFAWAESALDHTLCVSLHRSSEAGRAHGAAVPVVEAQPVNLDAFDQSLALGSHRPAAARGVSTDSGRPSAEEEGEDESLLERSNSRRRKGSSSRRQEETVAWATVELLDGVRVLTLTEERPPAAMSSLSVDEANLIIVVDVVGVGLSVVHAAGGEECLYVSATGLKLDAVLSTTAATFEFALSSFQIDNQLQYATLPAVLSLADPNPKPGTHALHLSVVKQLRAAGAAVDWWEYASCRLLELELAAEPILIQALLDFAYAARLPSLIRLLNGSQARLQYFRRLELHPVRLSITFHHNNNLGLERGAPLLLVPIPHIDDAAIHLSALLREHLVGTAEELALTLLNHYKFSLLRQLMLVLLQVDMLGDPVGFMRSWGTGVKDLFYLPAKAVVQRPREFGRAVAAGSASFAKNSIGAPINSIGKFVGGLERATDRALAAMDMGKSGGRWAQARESERRHGLDSRGAKAAAKESGRHLVDGTTKLGLGILSGVVGIVREPVKGAMSDGMRGFSIGVGKGIAGAAIRPTAGALAFASGMTGAVQGLGGETEATSTHSARVGRRRPPRRLQPNTAAAGAPQRRLVPYSLSEALAQQVLHSAGEGRYASEALLHFELLTPPAPSPPPGEGSRARAAVLVLTGVRLLVVDTGSWTATLNLQLRKVAGAEPDGDRLLLASSIVSSETSERRMLRGGGAPVEKRVRVACYSEQLAADLASRITTASFYARTRRTVLQQSRALTRGGLGESSSSAATALGREMSELSASTSLWDESEDSHGGVAPRSLTPSSILEQEEEGNPAAAR